MSSNLITASLYRPQGASLQLPAWLVPRRPQLISQWTLEQLNIQPYQHLLEIGYGTGHTLEQVASRLRIGFIAGIDRSVSMYQQALRRNRKSIDKELMQLHTGRLQDLAYPHRYFHTIYGINTHFLWPDPQQEFMRLASLLSNGGRLIMTFQTPSHPDAVNEAVEKTEADMLAAGLTDIRMRYIDLRASTGVSITATRLDV